MATAPLTLARKQDYPTSDGRPMAESDLHRIVMVVLIDVLKRYFANDPLVFVSGNMLVFYVPGNKRKHVAPDVFVAWGVQDAKQLRDNYLLWEEGPIGLVIEVTSPTTKAEDQKTKFLLYRDVLKVEEYFLFDPRSEYLDPPLQGYRLEHGQYVQIQPVDGRLPSEKLGLHLEAADRMLRLYDPATRNWLPTADEREHQAEERERLAQEENRRLRQELEAFKRNKANGER